MAIYGPAPGLKGRTFEIFGSQQIGLEFLRLQYPTAGLCLSACAYKFVLGFGGRGDIIVVTYCCELSLKIEYTGHNTTAFVGGKKSNI